MAANPTPSLSNVLVLGGAGQLGTELTRQLSGHSNVFSAGSSECDLTDASQVKSFVAKSNADLVINCAAYTEVDKAEEEAEKAFNVNENGLNNLVAACPAPIQVIHVSTGFVFDGEKQTPYTPDDATSPLGVYGKSKLAGERILQEQMPSRSMIIITSWLYGKDGNNFVKTMLRLMSELDELSIVQDQIGVPTSTASLAHVITAIVHDSYFQAGIFHWADEGEISWYEFAVEIQRPGLELGLLSKEIPLRPIPSSQYPQAARRPRYSVLDSSKLLKLTKLKRTPWQENLRLMLMAQLSFPSGT